MQFFNGGVEAWEEAGKSLDKSEKKVTPATFKGKVMKERIATSEEMAKIGRGELNGENVIHSRTENEHKGSDIRAVRGGYIPNTKMNVSHVETYDVDTGRIHIMDELEKIFGKLDRDKRTKAYCQTVTRSTLI